MDNEKIIILTGPPTTGQGVKSTITGEPTGAIAFLNTVKISQADYDAAFLAGTLVSTTDYRIF